MVGYLADKKLSDKHAIAALAAREAAKNRKDAAGSGSVPRRGNFMLAVIRAIPALLFPVAIYNLLALSGNQAATIIPKRAEDGTILTDSAGNEIGTFVAPLLETLEKPFMSMPMMGDVTWQLSNGDLLIVLAIFCLFWEIVKSTSTGTATIINHAISMILFIVCLVQFLLFPNFATSVFFVITLMCLLDVLAGVVVTIVSARRDFGVGEGFGG